MASETKALIIALSKIVSKADSIAEIYEALSEIADADGVKLKPFTEKNGEEKER